MDICLVTNDPHVGQICKDAFATLQVQDWRLICRMPENQRGADVYVWDLDSFPQALHELRTKQSSAHILLLKMCHLPRLKNVLTIPLVSLLLKPLNAAFFAVVLETVVQQATLRHQNSSAESIAAGSQKDEIFHCLLQACLRVQQCQLDRMNFFARALHDFNSPLTAIGGYCSLLASRRLGDLTARQMETVERMQASVQRLASIADDALRFSMTPQAKQGVQLQNGDVEGCLEEAVKRVAALAAAKDISISVDVAPPREPLSIEAAELTRVLGILLENACQFTYRHGSVDVRASSVFWKSYDGRSWRSREMQSPSSNSKEPNAYRIDLTDSGPGIPTGRLNNIFEPDVCYAGNNDRAGGGLSLAICKVIITAHMGKIFATSGSKGVRFSIILRYSYDDQDAVSL